jgi:Tfp pilus assembly protein PilV
MRTDAGGEMNIRERNLTMTLRSAGFSMLDALVAIVVLATGLLALAALQGAMTRNGVDARARSQIASYTESVIDRMRFAGYDAVAPGTIANGQTITAATTCQAGSVALSLANRLASDAKCAQDASGVSNLQTVVAATQWWGSGGTFTQTAPTVVTNVPNYKQVNVTSTWTDATGQARSLSYDTTVSPITVDTTNASLAAVNFSVATGSNPVVRESNPAATVGVIPIAVSSSQNAAATNPAPLVTNTGTTFTTITYTAATDPLGGNRIDQRIDTKVMRCSCKYTASGGVVSTDTNLTAILTQPYAATYWDGTTYVDPDKTTATSSTTGVDSTATQDSDCDICCRDRNDVAGNTVLFDNYSTDYQKYQYVSNILTAVTSGSFVQTCRMIRVEGVYAVATDIKNYFFGILDTEPCSTAGASNSPTDPVTQTTCTSSNAESSAVPTSTATTNYQSFVKDYLFNNFSSLDTTGKPSYAPSNPQLTDSPALLYNTTYSLNTPTSITIAQASDTRFLHTRGLYIDHLESKAQTALANAISSCSGTDQTSLINCGVYATVPFTTVNMTELAYWSASAPSIITTPVNASVGGVGKNPARGYAYSFSSTTNGTVNDIATVNQMPSGLTGITSQAATTLYDSTHNLLDQKQFVVGSGSSSGGGGGNSVYFDVTLSGLGWIASQSNVSLDPSVAWSATTAQMGTAVSSTNMVSYQTGSSGNWGVTYAGSSTTTTTPAGCKKNCTITTTYSPNAATPSSPVTAPVGLNVTVQGFNTCAGNKYAADGVTVTPCPTATGSGSDTVTCTNALGGSPVTVTETTGTQCTAYQVDTANIMVNSTIVAGATASLMSGTTSGGQLEGQSIMIPNSPGISSTTNTIANADLITIGFKSPITTVMPGTCVCTSKNCPSNKQVYTPGTCPK